jgi:hypothetical protein
MTNDDCLALADLWTRVEMACAERGWSAEIYLRDGSDGKIDQFGRIGVRVRTSDTDTMTSFGNTSNEAIRRMAAILSDHGFDT